MFRSIAKLYHPALLAGSSLIALTAASATVHAQSTDIGAVNVTTTGDVPATAPANGGLPISAPGAIGSKAPVGTAPALAPSQAPLNSFEPGSLVSDKVIQDIAKPSSDYNEIAKYTPGFVSSNPNGTGDSKSGWRGFQDGQFNITYDGIPFGDANDPTHHSAAYFPAAFIGSAILDRGPGAASQVGYATFGGTFALYSYDLTNDPRATFDTSFGNFNTFTTSVRFQTGNLNPSGTKLMVQFSHIGSDGRQDFGSVRSDQFLAKLEQPLGDVTLTAFATYGREHYTNVNSITFPQFQSFGKNYGEVNGNPFSQQYFGYNNSVKATDLDYIDLKGDTFGFHFDNKVYTYAYYYPVLQNNGADQTIEGNASIANGGTINSISIPTIAGGKTKVAINGVNNGDVTGYVKNNNYRAVGDIFTISRDFKAGFASGTLRAGVWAEHIDNTRSQLYIDYTTQSTYTQLGNSTQASYKLNLQSKITNVQPFVEYDWKPIDRLTITPGYKFESFTRDHNAAVNQTTLQPLNYSATYTANLPFLAARYRLTPETTVYGQASKGFLAPTVSAFYVFDPTQNNIQPQSTTNYQTGVVYKSEKFTGDFDLYQITANNFPLVTTTPTGQQFYQNAGTARYRGIEAEGSYILVKGLAAYASGALSDAKYIEGTFQGLAVGSAPRYTAAGGLVYDDGTYFGSALYKITGDSYGSNGQKYASVTTDPTLNKIPSYDTTDLVVGARFTSLASLGVGKKAEVKFGVSNIFDRRAVTDISGDPTGLTSIINTKLTYSFQPGRLIYGGLKVDF